MFQGGVNAAPGGSPYIKYPLHTYFNTGVLDITSWFQGGTVLSTPTQNKLDLTIGITQWHNFYPMGHIICREKLHLQSYFEILWSEMGHFGLLGNNHILFIILLYLIKG